MRIHILTSNTFLRIGVMALAEKNGFVINPLYPDDEHYLNELRFNDMVIFHVDRLAPLSLLKFEELRGRTKLILINPHNIRLEAICQVNETVDECASLTHFLASILKTVNKPAYYQNKYVSLSVREQKILIDILGGIDVHVIANRLRVSVKTIYAHKLNAYKKLGVKKIHDILPLKNLILANYYPLKQRVDVEYSKPLFSYMPLG